MSEEFTKRRDSRFTLKADRAFVEFEDPHDGLTRWCGRLVSLSVAGLSFTLDVRVHIEPGALLQGVTLRVGDCTIDGAIAVKNARPVNDDTVAFGGLFYPRTEDKACLLMALIAGMEAVDLEPETIDCDIARGVEGDTREVLST